MWSINPQVLFLLVGLALIGIGVAGAKMNSTFSTFCMVVFGLACVGIGAGW